MMALIFKSSHTTRYLQTIWSWCGHIMGEIQNCANNNLICTSTTGNWQTSSLGFGEFLYRPFTVKRNASFSKQVYYLLCMCNVKQPFFMLYKQFIVKPYNFSCWQQKERFIYDWKNSTGLYAHYMNWAWTIV